MKTKGSSRSASPASSPITTVKSPSKSAPKSPTKAMPKNLPKTPAKLSVKAVSPARTPSKSPAKDVTKSPAKSKTASSSPTKQGTKQQKASPKQPMQRSTTAQTKGISERRADGQSRAKSPRPSAKPSPSKASQAGKGNVETKQKNTRISKAKGKVKDKSPGKKQTHDGLACGRKRTPLKKTPMKGITKTKKKKIQRELSTSQFIDLWTLANIGKREASLNASMKVNIMYESATKSPPKQSPGKTCNGAHEMKKEEEQGKSNTKKSSPESKDRVTESEEKKAKRPMLSVSKGAKSKKLSVTAALKVRQKSGLSSPSKKALPEQRKRKSPHYKIFKEEPVTKSRKIETTKKAKPVAKSKGKAMKNAKKKKSKVAPSGHHLCNIIEKSPRQASLIAKAMIAMEQEEDVVPESAAARTKLYDWQELRPQHQSSRRRLVWVSGLAKSLGGKDGRGDAKLVDTANGNDSASGSLPSTMAPEPSEALQSALLRTLHEVGDPRLLREFYRAQRDDFSGYVDVEKYDPAPLPPPRKETGGPPTATISPVKDVSNSPAKAKPMPTDAASAPVKKPPKVGVSEKKSGTCSPAKPQPCRVATPIPQFPHGRRTSHMTSFIHHPIGQQHQQQQQFHKQQQEQQRQPYPQKQAPQPAHTHHPQPIKVTPYSPGPAFIYQFVPPPPSSPSPSPLPYGLAGTTSPAPHGDFQSSFTLSHMGSLSLGRRGVNPYEPAYNNSMQQVGFGFPPYYPASLQALHQPQNMQSLSNLPGLQSLPNLSAVPGLQNLGNLQPMGVQQFPLVQPAPVVAHQQLPHDMTQFSPLRTNFPSYSHLSPSRDGAGFVRPQPMMPPPAHSHKPTHTPMGPPPAPPITPSARPGSSPHRQQHQHQQLHHHHLQQQLQQTSPIESLRTMNPQGVQPILQSRILQFPNSTAPYSQPQAYHTLAQPVRHQHVNLLPKPLTPVKPAGGTPQTQHHNAGGGNTSHFLQTHSAVCKKEISTDSRTPNCDNNMIHKPPSTCNAEVQTKPAVNRRTSTEAADISDLLHSAHSAMFATESGTPPAPGRDTLPPPQPASFSSDPPCNSSSYGSGPSQVRSGAGPAVTPSFSAAYSVSTILDLPSQKLKSEPQATVASCEFGPQVVQNSFSLVANSPSNLDNIAFPSNVSHITGTESTGTGPYSVLAVVKKEPEDKPQAKEIEESCKQENAPKKRKAGPIIIEDSEEESSEDEPLAKLIKKNPAPKVLTKPTAQVSGKPQLVQSPSKINSVKPISLNGTKQKRTSIKQKMVPISPIKSKQKPKVSPVKLKSVRKPKKAAKVAVAVSPLKKGAARKPKVKRAGKTTGKSASSKPKKPTAKKARLDFLNAQSLARPINNHGWSWIGEGSVEPVPKLTISREEQVRMRRCFKSMRHESGEQVAVGDCVLLQSDGTDGNVPYVARVTRLWEALNGEKMFSMLWYYQPEHTATGREAEDGEQELFASKHREENSVACIDKCYVLIYNEYCRLEAEAARHDQGVMMPRWREEMPGVSVEDQHLRRRPPPSNACVDNIWFSRYDYDIRKKYVRKPKHKKSSLRYRAPSKLV
ncbi:LOW QUALITY PROTEIN: bromo adjacent homology domain-containing 1 protein [Elysia marginata]|uniref:Bromo adjacent homology domain-containing 1 protein n=1 Tax=Elysia marginata TaxID=1093978 RepID=A0AAV4HA81_9GAST|nr:LOW QUALITY PROTEIN: bromo adjacent homology domain-containing 1 protein [Elysia marginata]